MSIQPKGGPQRRTASDMGPRPVPAATAPSRGADGFVKPSTKQTQLTVRIDAALHRQFKLATTREGVAMGEVVEDAVRAWLKEHDDI
mgnify:CR=1 FL=1